MNQHSSILIRITKYFLFATALTPLIFTKNTLFPFALGKIVFFRMLVEVALILFLLHILYDWYRNKSLRRINLQFLKNPIAVVLIIFFFSLAISTIFSVNSYRAFWGDVERGEGFFGTLHYFIFLGLTLLVFEKKDWLNFFKTSLVAGAVVIFYGFLQYFNITEFPFTLGWRERVQSYVGNSAFLGTYMLFVLISAAIVSILSHQKTKGFEIVKVRLWRYFSFALIPFSIIMVFLTGTRGTIAGLGVGVLALILYFMFSRNSTVRKTSIAFLIFFAIVGVTIFLTRDAALWQRVPGINRVLQTIESGASDSSTQTRLLAWRSSIEAFKEKPIFGWGPENYSVAYVKYYDPDYAIYGETWLDRAHNKLIDVAVMQGVVGLIAYFGIFGAIFYVLFRKTMRRVSVHEDGNSHIDQSESEPIIRIRPFLAAGFIAYFVQNLVLFDQVISYSLFFALLAFLVSSDPTTSSHTSQGLNARTPIRTDLDNKLGQIPKNLIRYIFFLLSVIIILASAYSLYTQNYIPYAQAKVAYKVIQKGGYIDEVVKNLQSAFYPYNFSQHNIRGKVHDVMYKNHVEIFEDPTLSSLSDLLVQGVAEVLSREPYDPRMFIRRAEVFEIKARDNTELYKIPEETMREAIRTLSQTRQELYYHLAFSLAGQDRFEESAETARQAIALSPNVPRAHYQYALMLVLSGENREEAERELALALELGGDEYRGFLEGDISGMVLIYRSWGRMDKAAGLVIEFIDGRVKTALNNRSIFEDALRYYATQTHEENFIKVASYLSRFDDLSEDMETLIDLAEKGRWDVIGGL